MQTVRTKDGDSLYSLFGYDWQWVYNLPENSLLRQNCPDPNLIKKDIDIYVPDSIATRSPVINDLPHVDYSAIRSMSEQNYRNKRIIRRAFLANIVKTTAEAELRYCYCKLLHDLDAVFAARLDFMYINFYASTAQVMEETKRGKPCYWIAVEPFRMFFDIDLYEAPDYSIREVIDKISPMCQHWLVCSQGKRYSHNEDRKSFSLYTDAYMTYASAKQIEAKLSAMFPTEHTKKFVANFTKEPYDAYVNCLGSIYRFWEPFTYRRSPWSFHGKYLEGRTIPDLDLSNLQKTDDLSVMEFSYPNH